MSEPSRDELAEEIAAWMDDPVYAKAYREAEERLARSIPVPCYWRHCVDDFDPVERRIIGGFGAAGCPCDNLPGWNARHPEQKPKPAAAVKARGRHGSRVQRSRRRHRYERHFLQRAKATDA